MQVSRLKMVADECSRDLADEGAAEVAGYYYHQDIWWNVADKSEAPNSLQLELSECLTLAQPHRATHSLSSNFPLADIQAVIRATFHRPLRQPRLDAIQRVLLRSFRNASNAFAVRYNEMTGLLGKAAFRELVTERLDAISAIGASTEKLKSDENIPSALCLLALDIDNFKQVNDSHGHAYGDLVIRSFAIRIDKAVRDFCAASTSKIEGTSAHVSGEEFFCIAWGPARTTEFEELAHAILVSVRDQTLPSENDLVLLQSTYSAQDLAIPPVGNRNITCSIGGIVSGAPGSQENRMVADQLISHADLALYRSKNHGRNRVTFFPTILHSGGRVLEFKSDVGVYIIDIGYEVGVIKGQEFVVFHPEFTGSTPYILDDGRSKKILGMLPRSSLCKITVFDVQRQISFCHVSEKPLLSVQIPRNSALEAIPLGTLSVPMSAPGLSSAADILLERVASIADTQKEITGPVSPDDELSFAVIGIRNEKLLLSNFGPAAVNRGLAAACRNLQELKSSTFLGQLEPTQLLIKYSSFGAKQHKELDEALGRAESDAIGRVNFIAGVFSPRYPKAEEGEPELPEITELNNRVDLARYAVSPEASEDNDRVRVFSYMTPVEILTQLKQLRDFQRGMADYQRFTQIGLKYAELENAAGLLVSASGDSAGAEALYLNAVALSPPSDVVYRLNAITVQIRQNNLDSAARLAAEVDEESLLSEYKNYVYGTANFAIALAHRTLTSGLPEDRQRALLWSDRILELDVNQTVKTRLEELRAAIGGT